MNICFLFQVQSAKYTLGFGSILAISLQKHVFATQQKQNSMGSCVCVLLLFETISF